ncbi:hypothetical protein EDC04DRAFT_3064896 [Pisolithus marmoratus]|nr:hypothetical protein EDC04DRAFT_3064896 [Pisolithus marmoratus]
MSKGSKPTTELKQHLPPTAIPEGLKPTTEELIKLCPRFRVLVVGKSGAGKSSLINRVFGIVTAGVADDRPGEAMIEKELISPQNDRFLLHDSRGFEPAEGRDYDTVKSFIEARKMKPHIKDQLHALWFCFPVPIIDYGERLLEEGMETFLEQSNEALGNIPTVVVFTKYDKLVAYMQATVTDNEDPEVEARRYLQQHCVEPIQKFLKGKDISHVAVSSNPHCAHGHKELTELTYERVSESFISQPIMVSAVLFAAAEAQRMVPRVKIEASINVAKQRYWRALASSPNFWGFTILNCLHVIHTDIVEAWNFYDPCGYLNSEIFRDLMIAMVGNMDGLTESSQGSTQLTRSDAFLGQRVHQKFMAYVVDLTHVLEILFTLKGNERGKRLTRKAIKLAFTAYFESSWMRNVHESIMQFKHTIKDRDAVINKIEDLVLASGREIHMSQIVVEIPTVDMEQDEEWYY